MWDAWGAVLLARGGRLRCVVLSRSIHFCWQESSDFSHAAAAGGPPKTWKRCFKFPAPKSGVLPPFPFWFSSRDRD